MIGREYDSLSGNDRRKAAHVLAKAGKALRPRRAGKHGEHGEHGGDDNDEREPNVHWQTASEA
jgi:hypothetical protein